MPGEAPQGSFEPFDPFDLVRPAGFGYVLKPFKMGSGTLFDCSAMTTLHPAADSFAGICWRL